MCFPRAFLRFLPALPLLLVVGACDRHGLDFVVAPEFEDVFSFESGLGDWAPRGRDLGADPWEVARSADRASDGAQSVRLRLDNANGQGKIWIERRYAVEKDQLYTVDVAFDLGSADYAGVSPWTVVVGAGPDSPATLGAPVGRGDSGNGLATDQGYRFVPRSHRFDATSDADGDLYVYVGVQGVAPGLRTYYVDALKVTLTRKGLSKPL